MTIVDTSVWIDFLEGNSHWTKDRLKSIIKDRECIAYIDIIILEVIQGVNEREDRHRISDYFDNFVQHKYKRSTILMAADIYQNMRRNGFTIRSLVDCLIASVAIETGSKILHKDRDFDHIAKLYPLILEAQESQSGSRGHRMRKGSNVDFKC